MSLWCLFLLILQLWIGFDYWGTGRMCLVLLCIKDQLCCTLCLNSPSHKTREADSLRCVWLCRTQPFCGRDHPSTSLSHFSQVYSEVSEAVPSQKWFSKWLPYWSQSLIALPPFPVTNTKHFVSGSSVSASVEQHGQCRAGRSWNVALPYFSFCWESWGGKSGSSEDNFECISLGSIFFLINWTWINFPILFPVWLSEDLCLCKGVYEWLEFVQRTGSILYRGAGLFCLKVIKKLPTEGTIKC